MNAQRVRSAIWLTLVFWLSNYAVLTLGTKLSGKEHFFEIAGMRLLSTLLGLGFCYGIHLVLRRVKTTRRRLIVLAIISPIAAETFAWAAFFAQALVDPTLSLNDVSWVETIRTIASWTWFFLAWSGLYLAVSYSFDVWEQQQQSAELREGAYVAQLRALHSQINPHFLFNSLNSVSALILDGRIEKADKMVSKLALFLRLGLAADPMSRIALSTELELQLAYLDLEQQRYEDLQVQLEVPERLMAVKVPALILQPIVENAVKYGVEGAPPPASILIRGREDNGRLELSVIDSGGSRIQSKVGNGIGLKNVRQRLALMYGDDNVDVLIGKLSDGRFQSQLLFPLEVS